MCYVGQATKIFFIVVAVLAAAGLVLGFGVLRLRLRPHHAAPSAGCEGDGCRPALPEPVPATPDAYPLPPLLSPPSPALGPARA